MPLTSIPIFSSAVEVLGSAVVRVDDLSRGLARDAVAVEGAEGRAAGGILVGRDRGFVERECLRDGPLDREAAEAITRDS